MGNSHFTEGLDYYECRLVKQIQENDNQIWGKDAKYAKRKDVQVKSAVFKPSDPVLTRSWLHNFKAASHSNGIHE